MWRRVFGTPRGGPQRSGRGPRATRLLVEALEGRLVPTTWFVATQGNDANPGTSPAQPLASIQAAVNQAASGDQILVAQGAYGYNAAADQLSASLRINPAVVMVFDKSVQIYGGFNSAFTVADPLLYHTVIEGGNATRGVYVLSDQHDIDFLMSGFTVEDGLGQSETHLDPATAGFDAIDGNGGGMWINDAARNGAGSFILQDMVFYKNTARSTSLATVSFSDGGSFGGGLAVRSVGNLALHRVTFSDNTAQNGTAAGGKFLRPAAGAGFDVDNKSLPGGGQVTGDNLIFVNNTATGPANTAGGAMAIDSANVTLQQVTAFNNQARNGQGGAFFLETSRITSSSNFSLTDASLRSNSTGQLSTGVGGALSALINTNVTLNRVQVLGNSAANGGGISLGGPTANITNSVFADNACSAPSTTDTSETTSGVLVSGGSANFTFTTFAQNTSSGTAVPAILLAGSIFSQPKVTATLTDCVIANHTNTSGVAAVAVGASNTLTYNHVLSANNTLLDNAGAPAGSSGTSSGGAFNGEATVTTAADAQFVAPGAPDYDYSIRSSSPAVGQGVAVAGVTIDIDQQPRGNPPDLGAYQHPPLPTARTTVATYDPGSGLWQLRNSNSTGFANLGMFTFGLGGNNSFPVVGRWNGTAVGIGEVEVIDSAIAGQGKVLTWKLRNSLTPGTPDVASFAYGAQGDIPVVGDWDGSGTTTVGIYQSNPEFGNPAGTWKLRNSTSAGAPDFNTGPGPTGFAFGGLPGDLPVTGSWNGSGATTVGVVERYLSPVLTWKLRAENSAGGPDAGSFAFGPSALGSFAVPGVGQVYGAADFAPVTGDWAGGGKTAVGLFSPTGEFLLRNTAQPGAPDATFAFGQGQERPLAADFAGV
jgi:hypothetical protein